MVHNTPSQSRPPQKEKGRLFGFDPQTPPVRDCDLAVQLNSRLKEKYRNYERAAARLELRGERDAAELLRKAAARVRLLRNAPQTSAPSETRAVLFPDTKA